jgi:hypothetical protein
MWIGSEASWRWSTDSGQKRWLIDPPGQQQHAAVRRGDGLADALADGKEIGRFAGLRAAYRKPFLAACR